MRSKILLGTINLEQIYVGYGGYINYRSNILFNKFIRNIFTKNETHQYESHVYIDDGN